MTSPKAVSVVLLSLACTILSVYLFANTRAGKVAGFHHTQDNGDDIAQPSEWVPFVADLVVTHAGSAEPIYGRFYRDAHGCGRLETGTKDKTSVISIHNIPRAEYYTWSDRKGQWTAGPMKLPRDGWHPIPRPRTLPGLKEYNPYVEVRLGKDYSLHSTTGLKAYSYLNTNGTLSLEIPDLNFFDVLKQTVDGRREAYSNIKFESQPEELFSVPPGAQIVTTARLGGIVNHSADELKNARASGAKP